MRKYGLWIVLALVVAGLVGVFMLGGNSDKSPDQSVKPSATSDGLPGLLTSEAPWPKNTDKLKERLDKIGMPALPQEAVDFHIHQHLDIFVHGKAVEVVPEIGINEAAGFITELHTHDTRGVIHVESPKKQDFYFGQFMDIWGVKFDKDHLGGYGSKDDSRVRVYVNGHEYTGDPRQLKLEAHQEIVLTYGTESELPNPIPASFNFTANE
ncbi:MAG TPA: hypothetical protein VLF21_03505 [Candidatus Saccharimonadales bacterium]|nr:hypothetical protein [Candidatus Saccharimonadales bacterium]